MIRDVLAKRCKACAVSISMGEKNPILVRITSSDSCVFKNNSSLSECCRAGRKCSFSPVGMRWVLELYVCQTCVYSVPFGCCAGKTFPTLKFCNMICFLRHLPPSSSLVDQTTTAAGHHLLDPSSFESVSEKTEDKTLKTNILIPKGSK